MLKIFVAIAICILITSILFYKRNKSRAELLSMLMISSCMLFVLTFFLSFRHAELSALTVLFGITILVLFFGFGKTKPISTWKGIFKEYREILYGNQYRVKDFASLAEVNRKLFAYWRKNIYALLSAAIITTLLVVIWVLIGKFLK